VKTTTIARLTPTYLHRAKSYAIFVGYNPSATGLELGCKTYLSMAEKVQKRKTMTPGALTANRANGSKSGRPSGPEKIELRDRIRARETDIVERLFHLAFHAQSEKAQVGSLRELLDRGWGRSFQPVTGADGLGPVMLQFCTGVATPDQWGNWDEPLALTGPDSNEISVKY
jgi:hypothetical protein